MNNDAEPGGVVCVTRWCFRDGAGAGLLTGAGLLITHISPVVDVDLGIDPRNVITMGLSLPDYKYRRQRSKLSSIAVAAESRACARNKAPEHRPADPVSFSSRRAAPGDARTRADGFLSNRHARFFQAMGTHLLAGRYFSARDNEGTTPVAIISETVARRYWPKSNPMGSHLTFWRESIRDKARA